MVHNEPIYHIFGGVYLNLLVCLLIYFLMGLITARIVCTRMVRLNISEGKSPRKDIEYTAAITFISWPIAIAMMALNYPAKVLQKFVEGGARRVIRQHEKQVEDRKFWESKLANGSQTEQELARVWLDGH